MKPGEKETPVLAIGLGKPKGPEADDSGEFEASDMDRMLGNAFDALEDKDREGFIRSMKACMGCGEE